MDTKKDSETNKPKQTLTGLIRSRVPQYEARQFAGETQKTFAEELTAEGHPISYADFRKLYTRARKQIKKAATNPTTAPMAARTIGAESTKVAAETVRSNSTDSAGYVHRDTSTYGDDDLF